MDKTAAMLAGGQLIPIIKTRLLILVAVLYWPASANAYMGVIVSDKEWYNPIDLVGYSWNQFSSVCGVGPCSGQLGGSGPDLTGWSWASQLQLGDLLNETTPHPGGIANFESPNDLSWGTAFFQLGFDVTSSMQTAIDFGLSGVLGYTSTLDDSGTDGIYGGVGVGLFPTVFRGSQAFNHESFGIGLDGTDSQLGGWLYRAAPVPLPGTFALLVFGIATLMRIRHRPLLLRDCQA